MKFFFQIISLGLCVAFICSCKKDPQIITDPKKAETDSCISVKFNTKELTCYPNDSIYWKFYVVLDDSSMLYNYKWIEPDTLKGLGPFEVNITSDLNFKIEIQNTFGRWCSKEITIKKDTINPLKHDYRDKFIGIYYCNVFELIRKDHYYNGQNAWYFYQNSYTRNVKVTKGVYFNTLFVENFSEFYFDSKFKGFKNHISNGTIKDDSLTIKINDPDLQRYYSGIKSK